MSIEFEAAGDGVFVVTLNRPERLNALDAGHKAALGDIWREAEARDDVRAIVLRGAGPKAFSAGSDFKEMKATGRTVDTDTLANAIPSVGVELTKPVVAALHGYVIGFGLTLAIHCDMRVAAPDARLAFPEVEHGMLSGISDITLPGIVGEAAALEIMLTGRAYSADEAREIRLVNRIAPDPHGEALQLAHALAGNSMSATRLTKKLVLAERRAAIARHLQLVAQARVDIAQSGRHASVVDGGGAQPRARMD
ncbi:MAG: enoyl-CoA hydratase/isomerase family protein [Alcaligenaceae bacterium]|nr:enoyl-CoA hydratase/isomerase family protein [Alcaligenaceae bacterium SAGV5]MPS52740.1 enoyl-CoA hydratase/isomerase family protein [Alcaligenaceae bacterium SAGV3]MPT60014.1 enoyl-CoA hydratase/isomerase family protein [Alcaligenaceae bacterium]